MSKLHHKPVQIGALKDMISLIAGRTKSIFQQIEPYVIVWWIFVASVTASSLPRIFGDFSGPISYIVTILGTAGCAWAWLFSRTLFRPLQSVGRWPIVAVITVAAVESGFAISSSLSSMGMSGTVNTSGEVLRVLGNAASMICISALVLVFVEALSGYSAAMPQSERRFRQAFIGVFGAMVATTILWISNAGVLTFAARWESAVLVSCAMIGVIASRAAISFRKRNPLIAGKSDARSKTSKPVIANDKYLAQHILNMIENEKLITTPGLKIATFAKALNEQEYKVTQCITGHLQYRNFNHFINAHRIEYAKRALTTADNHDRPILSIAFECGFNSIGPFNRAFKQIVGKTPRQYRMARDEEIQQLSNQ